MGSSRWIKWFSEEDTTEAGVEFGAALERAHDCLRVAEMPWFRVFLDELGSEALRPGKIGDHADMIASVARANTYKEIRGKVLDEIARARTFLESAKGD